MSARTARLNPNHRTTTTSSSESQSTKVSEGGGGIGIGGSSVTRNNKNCRQQAAAVESEAERRATTTNCTNNGRRSRNTHQSGAAAAIKKMVPLESIGSDSSLLDCSLGQLPDVASTETVVNKTFHRDSTEASAFYRSGRSEPAVLSTGGGSSFLLIDEKELLQVESAVDFCRRLGSAESSLVKVVSIFGNTGEGKSYTLNHAFFTGREVFRTSALQSSCTLGIWAAFDGERNVIVLDTEGLLGISANQNRRTRLLLKVLAISDVVIYRTRAERLHNDLFQFLGDASLAYLRHFTKELKATSERCGFGGRLSTLGPALVIFHETQHTRPLTKEGGVSCEEQVKQRFQDMNCNYDAFSAIHYVGVRTVDQPTKFDSLVDAVGRHLNDVTVRSPRQPAVVYHALQTLNGKFSGDIEETTASTFPDQYFTCSTRCLSCGVRCQNSMNHCSDNISHAAESKCKYQYQFDNRVFHCKFCHEQGRDEMVVPKTSSSNDSTWLGLAKYAWSGYVLECPSCGIIYRSRQYWYGNRDPVETVVRTEIQHVWPGGSTVLQGTQNAAQKVLDSVGYISNTVTSISAGPTKMLTSWMADRIAPPYWVPNSEILHCGICRQEFEVSDKKHHCRSCGHGFCDDCSNYFRPVPWRGWGHTPVRVCKRCNDTGNSPSSECPGGASDELTARWVGEMLHSTVGTVVSAMDYPLGIIKDNARPAYWIPDEDIRECHVCRTQFTPKLLKHHCRACGRGVCDSCSPEMKPVPRRGWDHPVRVCKQCTNKNNL